MADVQRLADPVDDPLASPGKHPIRPGGTSGHERHRQPRESHWSSPRHASGEVPRKRARLGNGGNDLYATGRRPRARMAGEKSAARRLLEPRRPVQRRRFQGMGQSGGGNRHGAFGISGRRQHALGGQVQEERRQRLEVAPETTGRQRLLLPVRPYTHRFYTQGMCSIAICELYGMSKDAKYKEPAQMAIDYCLRDPKPQGRMALQSKRRQRRFRDRLDRDGPAKCEGWPA